MEKIEKLIDELEIDIQYCKESFINEDEIENAKETLNQLKKALSIYIVGVTLKEKHKTIIIELEQDLKDYHRKHDKGKINDLEYLRHTSFIKGKLSVLYNL